MLGKLRSRVRSLREGVTVFFIRTLPGRKAQVQTIEVGTEAWRPYENVQKLLVDRIVLERLKKRFGLYLKMVDRRIYGPQTALELMTKEDFSKGSPYPEKKIEIKSLKEIAFLSPDHVHTLGRILNIHLLLPTGERVESTKIFDAGFWVLVSPDGKRNTVRR